jgi:hypothetical protein
LIPILVIILVILLMGVIGGFLGWDRFGVWSVFGPIAGMCLIVWLLCGGIGG